VNGGERSPRIESQMDRKEALGVISSAQPFPWLDTTACTSFRSQLRAPNAIAFEKRKNGCVQCGRGIFASEEAGASQETIEPNLIQPEVLNSAVRTDGDQFCWLAALPAPDVDGFCLPQATVVITGRNTMQEVAGHQKPFADRSTCFKWF